MTTQPMAHASAIPPRHAVLVGIGASYPHINLAAHTLATYARDAHWRTSVLELNINQPFDDSLRDIARLAPDVVGLSCYIWNADRALRLARALKAAFPRLIVVLGGPEVTHRAEEALAATDADAVVCGEGERPLRDLLASVHASGGTYGGPRILRAAEPLPPERWVDPYPEGVDGIADRIAYIETSRGCPFRCAYCLSSLDHGVRALHADRAIASLLRLRDRGARLIKLVDRTFNFDAARARAIWRALIERGDGARWHFEVCAHLLDEETLALLETAPQGLFQFEIGVQSVHEATRLRITREGPFDVVSRAVRRLREADNIELHIDLIAGLAGETLEDVGRSVDAVAALRPHRLQLGFLKMLPGSAARAQAERDGTAFAPDPPYEVLRTDAMPFDALSELHDIACAIDRYWNAPRHRATMRWLVDVHGKSVFALCRDLARVMRREGAFAGAASPMQRARVLYAYIAGSGLPIEQGRMAMAFDWLRTESQGLPDWLEGAVRMQRVAGLPRKAKVAAFAGDVVALYEEGRWEARETVVRIEPPLAMRIPPDGERGYAPVD